MSATFPPPSLESQASKIENLVNELTTSRSVVNNNQSMDIQAMQSMDWLFKKERIYLLAQFWQQRATLAEKEVSALKEQLAGQGADNNNKTPSSSTPSSSSMPSKQSSNEANSENHPGQGESGARPGFEQEIAAKEKEISQLSEDIQRLQTALGRAQDSTAAQVARLEEQLEQRSQRIARLEARLDAQKDYDDLKRELSILRALDLPAIAAATAAASESGGAASLGTPSVKALEMLNEAASALATRTTATPQPSVTEERTQTGGGSTTPSTPSVAAAAASLFPPGLQTVETFGSFLGEEIVANWRRSLERTILSQNAASSLPASQTQSQSQQQQQPQEAERSPLNEQRPSPPSTPEAESIKGPRASCSPPPAPSTPSMQQMLQQHQAALQQHMLMNGAPKSPSVDHSQGSGMNSPNGPPGLLNPPTSVAGAIMPSEPPKSSPFRFDERGPFRFDDRLGLGESLIPKGDPMEARLQEMLRYNMDQYANQNLDTMHIARRVRELLSIHNIGQRLFAKYVLGLSQGTVSELLSKPKPWDKLTEKGRDSYRKMHAWACDEGAVMLLKSLIPKKGEISRKQWLTGKEGAPNLPPFGGRPDEQIAEERIAHILSEASQAMKGPLAGAPPGVQANLAAAVAAAAAAAQQEDARSTDSRSPASAQEKVARIYQEELAKLMGRRLEDSLRAAQGGAGQGGPGQHFPSLLFPHFFGPAGPAGGMDRTHDEIRMALDAYHRELAKLNHNALQGGNIPPGLLGLHPQMPMLNGGGAGVGGGVQDLSLPKERPSSARDMKHSPHHSSSSSHNGPLSDVDDKGSVSKELTAATEAAVADALRHAGSAFSLVRPKTEPSPEDFATSSASPLQRMASITNSLISTPNTPSHHSPAQRPLKAVLPPITQQQFDQFNNLNTEDIVKKVRLLVKEQLSQYSISQRLFGESVLGLSQGSVSDLLARPKPWHMLTQKGREPFIRMKMFLEDENAVHKLVASQYKIAPEKLMRTGGYGSINPPGFEPMNFGIHRDRDHFHPKASMKSPASKTPKLPEQMAKAMESAAAALGNPMALLPSLAPPSAQSTPTSTPSLPPPMQTPPTPSPGLLRHPGSPPMTPDSPSSAASLLKKHSPAGNMPRAMAAAAAAMQQPSVYEMAALTQDLDTQLITTRIKEALLANNIGQKIFGEVVLGLSQGSVSELLSKPKPWHMLSIKGREPFIRMQLWLTDPNNVERLQQMKSERREANKRRRTTTGNNGPADNSSDTSSNDTADFYHMNDGSPGPPSAKKQRVLFSEEQKEALRLAFALDPYPNMATIEFLASELNLAARTITNWFHNHRMRLKQTIPHNNNDASPPNALSSNSSSSFDPGHFRLLLTQRLAEIHKERGGGAMPPFPFFNPSVAAMVSPAAASIPQIPPLAPPHLMMAAAMREQLSCLDLSMTSLKKDSDDDESGDDSDMDSNDDFRKTEQPAAPAAAPARSSRRKPAAPQWVNPEWQADEKEKDETKDSPPAIINGVCVMQGNNFDSLRRRSEDVDDETVRVEPTAAGQADKGAALADKDDDEPAEQTKLELNVTSAEQARQSDDDEDWEQKIEQDKQRSAKVDNGGAASDDWDF
ncbi:homeobox protein cut isoform X4 [Cloeon dipterum]|uniref:homeobox protein cut isoform X4 n=1 Tax=Cloeon dipterum TaxID=197152 RepID=UPI003220835F